MSTLTVGTISEKVSGAGVAVDGVTLKDGGVGTTSSAVALHASSLNGGQFGGRRNIIINGRMDLDQRNGGSEVVPASDAYTLDRFRYNASQASKLKVQQNAQADTPPEGFSNYLGVTVNATHTVASTDNFFLTYFVEGFDSAHLDFGKSTAKTVTLSFYVRSTLTGTFSGSIVNSAENRAYPYTYTISSADTWERKTITIAGDTSGTWIGATNGKGLMLTFSLGMGSNFTGTAGQWNGAQDFGATGETVKLVENASAEWKMTGLQLEVGQATPFEHLSYGETLALAQRYYTLLASGDAKTLANMQQYNSTTLFGVYPLPVEMRAVATLEQVTGTGYYNHFRNGGVDAFDELESDTSTARAMELHVGSGISGTAGHAGWVRTGNASSHVAVSAEL